MISLNVLVRARTSRHKPAKLAGMDRSTAEPTSEDVQAEFPAWHVWRGIAGLLYARRMMSSPPRATRGESPGELRGAMVKEEADIEAGTWAGITHGSI